MSNYANILKGNNSFNPTRGGAKVAPTSLIKVKETPSLTKAPTSKWGNFGGDGEEEEGLGFETDEKHDQIDNLFDELNALETINVDAEGNVTRKGNPSKMKNGKKETAKSNRRTTVSTSKLMRNNYK